MPLDESFSLSVWERDDITSKHMLEEMCHEIQLAVNLLRGHGELLQQSELSDEQRIDVETILNKTQYLDRIVEAARRYLIKSQE